MGVSTDAILCFGYSVEEGHSFPWTKKDADEGEYYDEDDWKKEFVPDVKSLPFQLVRHCSDIEPHYIVAIKTFRAYRGYPETLTDSDFSVSTDLIEEFISFNAKYSVIPKDIKPSWYLCSYWG